MFRMYHIQKPCFFFKKADCNSFASTGPLLVQCWLGWMWDKKRQMVDTEDVVLMKDHRAFDPKGITTSTRRMFYGVCSPTTNLTSTYPWEIAATDLPKETPVVIFSTTILQFRAGFLHCFQNSSLKFSSFMVLHFIVHWTKSFEHYYSSLAFIA